MTRLLARSSPPPLALALLILAAVAVSIGGFEHARLFHRGYSQVNVVGPLFMLNAIGSLVVVLALVFERVAVFVIGALAISAGSVVSILISHTSSFFGFSEGGYDSTATLILISEIAAIALCLLAVAAGSLRNRAVAA